MRISLVLSVILLSLILIACSTGSSSDSDDDIADDDDDDDDDTDDDDDDSVVYDDWIQVPLRTPKQEAAGMAGGEGMQMIWDLAYAPTDPSVAYLLSDTSQVWKSTDGGQSWGIAHKGFLANGGISLVVHPEDEDTVFVAGSQADFGSYEPEADGIYRTTDGGWSWERVHQTAFYRLADDRGGVNFAFTGPYTIYAGTHDEGILKTKDRGDTWTPMNLGIDEWILDVKAKDRYTLFVATRQTLYRLTDMGEPGLEDIGSGLPDYPRAVAVDPTDSDIVYVSLGKSGVYKSEDGGDSFNPCNHGLDPLGWDDGYAVTYLAISPTDRCRLYAGFYHLGGNHPYYTHDCGASWHAPTVMDKDGLIHEINNDEGGEWAGTPIAPHPTDENIAIASGAADHVEMTTDGGDIWTCSNDGYTGGRAGIGSTSFGWDHNDSQRFALFLIDFGAVLTRDGGSTFVNLKLPRHNDNITTHVGALDPTPGSQTIVTAVGNWEQQVIAVSHDEGGEWTLVPGTDDYYRFIAFHPQNPDIIYAEKQKSTDHGAHWNPMSRPVIAMFPANGDIVYSTEGSGGKTTVHKSADAGATWSQPYDDIDCPDVYEIAVDPQDQDRIYAASSDGVYIWDIARWLLRDDAHGLQKDRFDSVNTLYVTVDPAHPNVVYAGKWIAWRGHSNGVFRSMDYGQTWENITGNLGPEFTPWAISVNPHDSYVYIGSSHGTWKFPPP